MRALVAIALVACCAGVAGVAAVAEAQLPWSDTPARVVGDRVEAAALGSPDLRAPSFDARRRSARRRAEESARAMLHAHVDQVLGQLVASPATAERAHRAVERGAQVVAVRALVDGSAVAVVGVPRAELRAAAGHPEAPW